MKITCGSVVELTKLIETDLIERSRNKIDKRVSYNLAECGASALFSRSVNSYEWMTVLPRISSKKAKERHISRLLASPLVNISEVMSYYVPEIILKLSHGGKTVVLMIDQSQIREGIQILMVSVKFGGRAIPILWEIEETKGSIGFEIQQELLNKVKEMIPEGVQILLSADRFYGTKSLVEWCQNAGWGYRIRLKGNAIFLHDGGEIKAEEVGNLPESRAVGATFNNSEVKTNIGYLHEKGHKEPWIIAMDCVPTKGRILDYGMRWGIECMFSDFKSRGFGITETCVTKTDRLEVLILILTIALYWAVSIGGEEKSKNPEKKARSECSWFKTGLRVISHSAFYLCFSHILWSFI